MAWGHVLILCSDRLTRHVSERIRDVLRWMKSAKQACEDLLQAALDDGGTDNITIVVGEHYRGMSDVRSPCESYRASQLEVAHLNVYGLV